MNFGALRVVNDDYVQPKAGFGTHPHRDAEIFSYVLEGRLSHQDSMGHKEALGRGCVQYMSAGTGVSHSVSAVQQYRVRQAAVPLRAFCPLSPFESRLHTVLTGQSSTTHSMLQVPRLKGLLSGQSASRRRMITG